VADDEEIRNAKLRLKHGSVRLHERFLLHYDQPNPSTITMMAPRSSAAA
jgi:hypothetical protein